MLHRIALALAGLAAAGSLGCATTREASWTIYRVELTEQTQEAVALSAVSELAAEWQLAHRKPVPSSGAEAVYVRGNSAFRGILYITVDIRRGEALVEVALDPHAETDPGYLNELRADLERRLESAFPARVTSRIVTKRLSGEPPTRQAP